MNGAIAPIMAAWTFNGRRGECTSLHFTQRLTAAQCTLMRFSYLAFSIVVTLILTGSVAPIAKAQNVFVTVPVPRDSVSNQLIDFYAGGSSEGYSLRISPQGGTLSINDYDAVGLMPWGYVTAKWAAGPIYIIFLVNVTETNFRIGFLYLSNSSSQPFILRWFDYSADDVQTLSFQGDQYVFNRTVPTAAMELPHLRIPISAAVTNDLYALGPQLYLGAQSGLLLNGTSLLKIHPLMNQLFTGANDYNELWSLMEDDSGNYYFAILYMQNSDPSHVIIEHQLRLNDYRRFNGQTVDAKWSEGGFQNRVTVRTPVPNLTVKIDGFPFQTNSNGVAFTMVPNGIATVQVPDELTASANSKIRFSGWNKYGSSNPLSIRVNSTLDISAKYDQQYPLAVISEYGTAQGAGWYLFGANATFSVESDIEYGNGTRRVFQGWGGDSNSTTSQSWVIINSPKQVAAIWKTQFEVTVTTAGLPADLNTTVLVGGELVTLNGSAVHAQWADANQVLPITVQSTEIQGSTNNYFLSEVLADNQTFTGSLDVTMPSDISLVYSQKPKLATTLSLTVVPTVAVAGYPISITGSIDAAEPGPVDLQYSSANSTWQELATVSTSQSGAFAYAWRPTTPGEFSVKASWAGDATHSSAFQVVVIKVVSSSLPTVTGSDTLAQILQAGLAVVNRVPYVSALVSLAASLMVLGYVLTSFVVPGGSPLIGYLIGSFLVGFVYVFPVSAIIVLVKSARSRRRPSLLWLTPLLAVWLSSLVLVVLAPELVTPPELLVAARILLVVSNVFLVPMLAAFRLARVVA